MFCVKRPDLLSGLSCFPVPACYRQSLTVARKDAGAIEPVAQFHLAVRTTSTSPVEPTTAAFPVATPFTASLFFLHNAMARTKSNGSKDSTANLGFEAKLWLTADTAGQCRMSN